MMRLSLSHMAVSAIFVLLCHAAAEPEQFCNKDTPGCDEPVSLMQNPATQVNVRQKRQGTQLQPNTPEEGDISSMLQKQATSTKYAKLHSAVAQSSFMKQVIDQAKKTVEARRKQREGSGATSMSIKK
mmetsp:Transcript_51897/g.91170  ORF Transcript_51897/g.91170 Transcript_51897/m.91170 type:complete len:128 (-) Transcript_51897:26-409(-)